MVPLNTISNNRLRPTVQEGFAPSLKGGLLQLDQSHPIEDTLLPHSFLRWLIREMEEGIECRS